jgi:hypothetical protein
LLIVALSLSVLTINLGYGWAETGQALGEFTFVSQSRNAWDKAYAMPLLYDWLQRQRLPEK